MKDVKYNQEQNKTKQLSCKDSRKKKRKIEGKKLDRHIVYYVCSACNIPESTHIYGTQ
jgi:hypothetical protein